MRLRSLFGDHISLLGFLSFLLTNAIFMSSFVLIFMERSGLFYLVNLACALTPLVIGAILYSIHKQRRPRMVASEGRLLGYVLTNEALTFTVGQTFDLLRIPLHKIESMDRWVGLGVASFGTKENFLYQLFIGIWFWPVPPSVAFRHLFDAESPRYEYSLVINNGWIIVIGCSRQFISEVLRTTNHQKLCHQSMAQRWPRKRSQGRPGISYGPARLSPLCFVSLLQVPDKGFLLLYA